MSILGIIAFIVLLSVIIVVHELGHMLVAKHFVLPISSVIPLPSPFGVQSPGSPVSTP